jgi:hypothetical protein
MKTRDENEPRDFIDIYLSEIKKNEGNKYTTFTGT